MLRDLFALFRDHVQILSRVRSDRRPGRQPQRTNCVAASVDNNGFLETIYIDCHGNVTSFIGHIAHYSSKPIRPDFHSVRKQRYLVGMHHNMKARSCAVVALGLKWPGLHPR